MQSDSNYYIPSTLAAGDVDLQQTGRRVNHFYFGQYPHTTFNGDNTLEIHIIMHIIYYICSNIFKTTYTIYFFNILHIYLIASIYMLYPHIASYILHTALSQSGYERLIIFYCIVYDSQITISCTRPILCV